MAYPFQSKLDIKQDTSKKLKILSIALEVPITNVCECVVDYFYSLADKEKIKRARLVLEGKEDK